MVEPESRGNDAHWTSRGAAGLARRSVAATECTYESVIAHRIGQSTPIRLPVYRGLETSPESISHISLP